MPNYLWALNLTDLWTFTFLPNQTKSYADVFITSMPVGLVSLPISLCRGLPGCLIIGPFNSTRFRLAMAIRRLAIQRHRGTYESYGWAYRPAASSLLPVHGCTRASSTALPVCTDRRCYRLKIQRAVPRSAHRV